MGRGSQIKPGEQVAIEYFQAKGFSNIIHEPDGNVPPDLLLSSTIAVEVRRLNQFKNINGVNHPLENLEYDLMPRVRQIIKSYDLQQYTTTAFVSVDFKRPLKVNKMVIKEIEHVLRLHLDFIDQVVEYPIRDNLKIRFRPSKKNYNRPYVWASSVDSDGGGFVVSNILDSLKIIINEKQEKILPYRSKYATWWLAMNDKIGFGIDEIDLDHLISAFTIKTFFERIIFISPFESTQGIELIVPESVRM